MHIEYVCAPSSACLHKNFDYSIEWNFNLNNLAAKVPRAVRRETTVCAVFNTYKLNELKTSFYVKSSKKLKFFVVASH